LEAVWPSGHRREDTCTVRQQLPHALQGGAWKMVPDAEGMPGGAWRRVPDDQNVQGKAWGRVVLREKTSPVAGCPQLRKCGRL